jgi:copper chaperone CopZ
METQIILVDGMTCGGCVNGVERALERVPGVVKARASLERREAVVEGERLDVDVLARALEDAGYEVRAS